MTRYTLWKIIRKQDFSLTSRQVDSLADSVLKSYKDHSYDFSSATRTIFTQQGKKRVVYQYSSKTSSESILIQYLKTCIDDTFKITYASRSRIMNLLFNVLPAVKDMNDFVLIRTDFKSFFDSVYNRYVFDKYILPSSMRRDDKELLEEYVDSFKYCYAGLCLSNGLTEVICQDFDVRFKAALSQYGVFFYERYVDDILLITNHYISKDEFLCIAEDTIQEVFGDCPVKLSNNPNKFSLISRRNIQSTQSFNFLGYQFDISYDPNNSKKPFDFQYGIAKKKETKYTGIIGRAFIEYKKSGNIELFRQRLKIFSSRVVVARTIGSCAYDWITKGVVAHYNELQHHIGDLNPDTKNFLRNLYFDLCTKYGISVPYFLKQSASEESIYNLYSNMKRNRALVFEKKIGVSRKTLIEWVKKLNPNYDYKGKDYYRIVAEYLEMIRI